MESSIICWRTDIQGKYKPSSNIFVYLQNNVWEEIADKELNIHITNMEQRVQFEIQYYCEQSR